jgi:hypothetical protein
MAKGVAVGAAVAWAASAMPVKLNNKIRLKLNKSSLVAKFGFKEIFSCASGTVGSIRLSLP